MHGRTFVHVVVVVYTNWAESFWRGDITNTLLKKTFERVLKCAAHSSKRTFVKLDTGMEPGELALCEPHEVHVRTVNGAQSFLEKLSHGRTDVTRGPGVKSLFSSSCVGLSSSFFTPLPFLIPEGSKSCRNRAAVLRWE